MTITHHHLLRATWVTLGVSILSATPVFAVNCPSGQTPGVLVDCIDPDWDFKQYLDHILKADMKYILLVAIIMIVFSGIQYMLSGTGSPDLQKKAKERIFTILLGVAFLLLAQALVGQLSSNL